MIVKLSHPRDYKIITEEIGRNTYVSDNLKLNIMNIDLSNLKSSELANLHYALGEARKIANPKIKEVLWDAMLKVGDEWDIRDEEAQQASIEE